MKRQKQTVETCSQELRRYVRFDEGDAKALSAFAVRAQAHFRPIADAFYERIREHEDAHAVFTGEDQIRRLQDSLIDWLERVFGGVYDESYFVRTEQIGTAHVRVGLPQRYVVGGMALLRSLLFDIIDEEATPQEDTPAIRRALSRLLDIELAVMLESYRRDALRRLAHVSDLGRERAVGDEAAAYARAHAHYVNAVELAPLLVIGLDRNGGIVLFNRAAERTTGYARDEVLGRSFIELFLPPHLHDDEKSALFGSKGRRLGADAGNDDAGAPAPATDDEATMDAPLITRAGNVRSVRWNAARAPDSDAHADRFVIGADVTDELLERDRQNQQERLAAVGSLAAGLAHEIRNPLNGARLHISLLKRSLAARTAAPCSDALEAVEVIDTETRRLARLVSDFLEFARPSPIAHAKTSMQILTDRIRKAVGDAAEAAKVDIAFDLPTHDLVLDVDVERIRKALLNLIHNAIEALAPQGGGHVIVRARREPHQAVIDIEDDGPGIDQNQNEGRSIFDAFVSTKPHGTGLGLAIVQRVISDHGGTIEVDSRPGRTQFRLKLPIDYLEAG